MVFTRDRIAKVVVSGIAVIVKSSNRRHDIEVGIPTRAGGHGDVVDVQVRVSSVGVHVDSPARSEIDKHVRSVSERAPIGSVLQRKGLAIGQGADESRS